MGNRGVHREGVAEGTPTGLDAGDGTDGLYAWMDALSARLRKVRVASGDWQRVLTNAPTTQLGLTGIFLDPPYGLSGRTGNLYAGDVPENDIAADVKEWCEANGDNPNLRIALCGYDTEHDTLKKAGWREYKWTARGGYGVQGENAAKENKYRERIWFSPACNWEDQLTLF